MHNAPSYVFELTREFFEHKRFKGEKIMAWPPSNSDLNLMVNCEDDFYIKVANNITAKQTCGKQLKLPCQKLNLLK